NTVLIYPNTAVKQKDYLDLSVKTFYLANADVKAVFVMLKTVLKTKDLYADEKLNSLTMRDTPSAIALAGKLIARQVQAGDRVTAGQILARLDPSESAPQTAAAKAQWLGAETDLKLANADLQRIVDLREKGFVSEAQVDRQRAAVDAAKARLEAAQAQLAQASNAVEFQVIRADAPGVVVGLDAELGQVIAAGQSVMRLARDGEREALIYLPETKMPGLALGQAWLVWLAGERGAQARRYQAFIREISPLAEPGTRTFAIRLALREPMAGMPLGVSLQAQALSPDKQAARGELLMPTTALYSRDGKTYVWKVDESSATVRLVAVDLLGYSDQGVRLRSA
ncbi:MAG: efflux RND transporter periplasmic adaptor subunit, partial [Betaproteobacteria bacterium]|nr:efflux RND transporter periplasmic adaptor subunit [Betaproteobacteria bacterium]